MEELCLHNIVLIVNGGLNYIILKIYKKMGHEMHFMAHFNF